MRVKWISTFIVDRYCKLIAMEFVVGIIDCTNDVFVKRYSAIKSTAPTKSRHFTKRDFPNYCTELLRCSNNDDDDDDDDNNNVKNNDDDNNNNNNNTNNNNNNLKWNPVSELIKLVL